MQWYRNGIKVDSSSSLTVQVEGNRTTLRVSDVQQSAVYQCQVSNEHGSQLASVFLCTEQEGESDSFLVICGLASVCVCVWGGGEGGLVHG